MCVTRIQNTNIPQVYAPCMQDPKEKMVKFEKKNFNKDDLKFTCNRFDMDNYRNGSGPLFCN